MAVWAAANDLLRHVDDRTIQLAQQSFAAFRGDIGITSALLPDKNCGPTQTDCLNAPMSLTIPTTGMLSKSASPIPVRALVNPGPGTTEKTPTSPVARA